MRGLAYSSHDYMADRRDEQDAAAERAELENKKRARAIAEAYPDSPIDFADKSKLTAEQIHALDNEWAQDEYSKFIDAISAHQAQGRISKMENAA